MNASSAGAHGAQPAGEPQDGPAGSHAVGASPDPADAASRLAAPAPSRGSFAMAAVVTALAVFLTYGLVVMDVQENAEGGPGPQLFPGLVLTLAWVVAVGLVVDAVRERRTAHRASTQARSTQARSTQVRSEPAAAPSADAAAGSAGLADAVDDEVADEDSRSGAPTDWRSVALVAGTFAVFIAVLVPLGWLVAGTWLFWGTAQSLGSRRRLFDLGVALAVASVVQLAFGAGLGLNLPAGVLAL